MVGIDLGSSGVVAVRRDDDGTVVPVPVDTAGPVEDVLRAVRAAVDAEGVSVVVADPGERAEELRAAASAAGWTEVTVVPQAVAAANYLGRVIGSPVPPGRAVAVYDVGARLTVSVVRNEDSQLRVVASGSADAGGNAMDAALAEELSVEVAAARAAREALTAAPRTQVGERSLTRAQLETAIRPVLDSGLTELDRVLDTAGITPDQLVGLILVGGAARMPLLARAVRDRVGLEPIRSANPERSIAEGLLVSEVPEAPAGEPTVLVPFGEETPPTTALPTEAMPATATPTEATPTEAMPTDAMPTEAVPTEAMPTEAVPTEAMPTEAMPTEATPTTAMPTAVLPPSVPPAAPPMSPPRPARSRRQWTLIGAAALLALVLTGGGVGWALAGGQEEPLPDPVVTTTTPDESPSPSDTPISVVDPVVVVEEPIPTPEESSESPAPEESSESPTPEPEVDYADGFDVSEHSDDGSVQFVTPSGNIGCYMDAEFARCDIQERDWSVDKPSDCEQDYGFAMAVGESSSSFVCAGDTVGFDGFTLDYGSGARIGDFLCTSSDSGVVCVNESTGDGFKMSRADYEWI
jgi:Tfp pilus assembly PilM family ATPase